MEALAKQAKADADAAKARTDAAKARADDAKARADAARARADAAKLARIEADKTTQKWLESLTDEQKDAIYPGPIAFGNILWIRIDSKYAVGPRDSTDWLIDTFARAPRQ